MTTTMMNLSSWMTNLVQITILQMTHPPVLISSNDNDDQGRKDEHKIQVGDRDKNPHREIPRQPYVHVPMEPALDDAVAINQPAENQGVQGEDNVEYQGVEDGVNDCQSRPG
jgi:hypothetical protein